MAGGQSTILEKLTELKFRYFCTNGLIHGELADVLRMSLGK
jgi:hypothetical protein